MVRSESAQLKNWTDSPLGSAEALYQRGSAASLEANLVEVPCSVWEAWGA